MKNENAVLSDERARQYFIKRIKKVSEELDITSAQRIYYFILGYIGTDENGGGDRKKRMLIRHRYYRTCPVCGANLDPDEKCSCEEGDENGKIV